MQLLLFSERCHRCTRITPGLKKLLCLPSGIKHFIFLLKTSYSKNGNFFLHRLLQSDFKNQNDRLLRFETLSLSSRPGSVVADVQLEVASPNMSVIFDVVSAMGTLGNFSLDRNETKMTIEQGIFTELNCMSISVKRVGITQRSTKLPTTCRSAQSAEDQIMMREIGSYLSAPSPSHQVMYLVNSLKTVRFKNHGLSVRQTVCRTNRSHIDLYVKRRGSYS